jgi:hypothetical protein
MLDSFSAVTLGTHDMASAIRLYRMLGFVIVHGGEEQPLPASGPEGGAISISSLSRPSELGPGGDGSSSTIPTSMRSTRAARRDGERGIGAIGARLGPRRSALGAAVAFFRDDQLAEVALGH